MTRENTKRNGRLILYFCLHQQPFNIRGGGGGEERERATYSYFCFASRAVQNMVTEIEYCLLQHMPKT